MTTGYESYGFVADLYDHVLPYRARQDVAFFVEAAKASGGPVLEVGSGTGRVLLPSARAGVEIVGLDASTLMLDICRAHLIDEPADVQKRVRLVEADMRAFDLNERFALITIPFRPFQHLLTIADQLACLTSIHRHLRDTGRFILDVFDPWLEAIVTRPIGEIYAEEPEFETPDGRRVVRRHRQAALDRVQQVMDAELIYDVTHPDGRKEQLVHAFKMRYLFRFEVEHLLARAGFEIEHLYGGYDKSVYGSRQPGELIAVARKARA